MRLVFAGTPQFAIPTLNLLLRRHAILAVITQSPKPAHRGHKETRSEVHDFALQHNLPIVTQPINDLGKVIRKLRPDCIVVAAYGHIVRQDIFEIPPRGVINVHASLLPKYRGAAPIQAAILSGDTVTGATIMQMVKELDAGPIIAQGITPIASDETAISLHDKLSHLGAHLLDEVLALYAYRPFPLTAQNDAKATYAPKIEPHDAEIIATEPAILTERKIRAYNPWPGAFFKKLKIQNSKFKTIGRLKIFKAEIKNQELIPDQNTIGSLIAFNKFPALVCSDGNLLVLKEVQPAGKKRMSGEEFVSGYLQ